MRRIIELPPHWNASQVLAILDLLEVLHQGLRDQYQHELHEFLAEHPDEDDHDHDLPSPIPEFDDDIPF